MQYSENCTNASRMLQQVEKAYVLETVPWSTRTLLFVLYCTVRIIISLPSDAYVWEDLLYPYSIRWNLQTIQY